MNFASDNIAPAHPAVFDALNRANQRSDMPYGADAQTAELDSRLTELFGRRVEAFPVTNGTSANCLSLSTICPAYGGVFCTDKAHIASDEVNAPAFFTGGARLLTLPHKDGKLSLESVEEVFAQSRLDRIHSPKPSAISVTQLTELGTCYTIEELAALADLAHKHDMYLHVDGARFANACAAQACSAADMVAGGVDILSFGFTKNGAMAAEVVVFFNPDLARDFARRRKNGGQLWSKMRFLSAQANALLEDDLWLKLARISNSRGAEIAAMFKAKQIHPKYAVDGNQVFVSLADAQAKVLQDAGLIFYNVDKAAKLYRFMAHWHTTDEEMGQLEKALAL